MKTSVALTYSELLNFYEQYHNNINYSENPKELYDAVRHIMEIKGKRIRPLLLLLSCDLFEGNIEEAIQPALAYEMFHNFTLVHDDIMDEATVRRGKPTVHKTFGNSTAILAGDVMLLYAYRFFENINNKTLPAALQLFTKTAIEIMEGQQLDMNFEKQEIVSEAEYLNMIKLKTSVLLAATAQTGAMLANADDESQEHLYLFGLNLGLAFQIKDDYLDAFGDAERVGKKIGGDILQDKKTYLHIVANECADERQKQILINLRSLTSEEKINTTLLIYDQLQIKEKVEQKMNAYYKKAIQHLNAVAVLDEKKEQLRAFSNFIFNRKY